MERTFSIGKETGHSSRSATRKAAHTLKLFWAGS